MYAFIKANLLVTWLILFVPRSQITPELFSYDVSGMTKGEILILTHCITLTPGTITVAVDEEKDALLIHCLDYSDPAKTEASITRLLKGSIMRFTR